ncbi:MAG: Rv3235 family protein [Frankiaceae bacterium]
MTIHLSGPGASTGVRILPARPCEPRYDDELGDDAARLPVEGALALALPMGTDQAAARRLRLVVSAADDRASDRPGAVDPAADVPPPPKAWIGRLVHALTEVLAGDRPLPQLAPYLSHEVYSSLDEELAGRARRSGRRPPALPTVRALRVCEPRAGVAEVAAVVRRGPRLAALAMRLEAGDGRWRCTVLQVG